jgi:hypothetical protein
MVIVYGHLLVQSQLWCRFIGYELYEANASFRSAVEEAILSTYPNATIDITFLPGVRAPTYGPNGLNGSREAYAPTPGQGFHLLTSPSMWQS